MSIDQFLHLGMRALRNGDAERAAEVFHHFNDLRPADARGYVGLALLEKRRWALDRACYRAERRYFYSLRNCAFVLATPLPALTIWKSTKPCG